MSWLGANFLADDHWTHRGYPCLHGQYHRMTEKVMDWRTVSSSTSSSSSSIQHLSSADDPYTARYGDSAYKETQQPALALATSSPFAASLQTCGLQQRSEFTIPYAADTDSGSGATGGVCVAAQTGVLYDTLKACKYQEDTQAHLGQHGINAAMSFPDSGVGVASAVDAAPSSMSATTQRAPPGVARLSSVPTVASGMHRQQVHDVRPARPEVRPARPGVPMPAHLPLAGAVRAPNALPPSQFGTWQAAQPTRVCSSDPSPAPDTSSNSINGADHSSLYLPHGQQQATLSLPPHHLTSSQLGGIPHPSQATPHAFVPPVYAPQGYPLQGFSGQGPIQHALARQDQVYQDGPLISQEAMDEATESHLAKQQFPVTTTAILRQWLRHNILNPYADQVTKQQLAEKTGLSTEQVAAWMTNARRRLVPKVIILENGRRSAKGLPPLPPVQLKDKYPLGKQNSPGPSAGEPSP